MIATRRLAQLVSSIAFLGTITPAVLFAFGTMTLDQVKLWTLVATGVWYVATPVWMDRPAEDTRQTMEHA